MSCTKNLTYKSCMITKRNYKVYIAFYKYVYKSFKNLKFNFVFQIEYYIFYIAVRKINYIKF